MLTATDVTLVRDIIGQYGATVTDEALMNETSLAETWSTLLDLCPDIETIIDPADEIKINRAQAYLLAARAAESAVVVTSTRLGDIATTFDNARRDQVIASWRQRASVLVHDVCEVVVEDQPSRVASFFSVARGQRGGARRHVEGSNW